MSGKVLKFSTSLGASIESNSRLISRNESEIKLLEDMRVYIEKRSKIDAEYAEKISKLKNTAKSSHTTNDDDSFLQKVCYLSFIVNFV